MQRRDFLHDVVTASAGLSLTALAGSSAAGANERVRVGVIGCGQRGRFVAERVAQVANVQIVAACDVNQRKHGLLQSAIGRPCETFSDFRQILDRTDIDAVIVATPDHWHAIPTVLACDSGKDVYVEKPLAHNIVEGRAIVTAAHRNRRVVQTGTQQRSAAHFETMRELISDGRIGNIRYVRVWNYKNTTSRRRTVASSGGPPAGLDWDMYLGPAPLVPYDSNRYHNFRRYWDYAGGIATNYGTHRFDSVRHVMSLEGKSPRTVAAVGHRFEVHDGSEDPDVVQMTFEFDDFVLSYEGCMTNAFGMGYRTDGRPYYRMLGHKDRPHGMAFYGTRGAIFADRLGFELYPELKPGERTDRLQPEQVKPEMFQTASASGRSDDSTFLHAQNFIECVRTRAKPVAEAAIGHESSILPHLGNIACRTGQKLVWNAAAEKIENSPEAAALLGRDARPPFDLI